MQKKKRRTPRRILVIDVGGSNVKFRVCPTQKGTTRMGQGDDASGETIKFASGPELQPKAMVRKLRELVRDTPYDAVSIGYPGLVIHGRITAEPYNLGRGWVGYDFGRAFGKPVRVINDAAMQAIGSYQGGRMLFLGLGTGLGATLILNRVVEPMEIGHLPFRNGLTYEEFVGERGRKRLGNRKWRKTVAEVVKQLHRVLEVDYVVLGGGNARRLKKLPAHSRLGDNRNAFAGGVRIWQSTDDPLVLA